MISIVIPAYNEEKLISKCLNALANQKTDKKFEVILVDNNSTDKTVEIAGNFSNKLNLKIVPEKKQGRGAARYTGFKKASGNIILSTDADIIFPPTWVEDLSNALIQSNTVAVTGSLKINDCGWLKNTLFNYFIVPLSVRGYRLVVDHYWLNGFNFGIYKEVYEKSGGFNPELNAEEDVDLGFKTAKIGKIKYIPSISVISSGRRFQNKFIKGLLSYPFIFFQYYVLKKEKIILSDIR